MQTPQTPQVKRQQEYLPQTAKPFKRLSATSMPTQNVPEEAWAFKYFIFIEYKMDNITEYYY